MLNLPKPHGYGVPQIVNSWNQKQQRDQRKQEFNKQYGLQKEGLELKQQQFEQNKKQQESLQEERMFQRQYKVAEQGFKLFDIGSKHIDDGNIDLGMGMSIKGLESITKGFPGLELNLEEFKKLPEKKAQQAELKKQTMAGFQKLLAKGDAKSVQQAESFLLAAIPTKLVDEKTFEYAKGLVSQARERLKTKDDGFSLSKGQKRYDGDGNEIASNASTENDRTQMITSDGSDGLAKGTVYTKDPNGGIKVLQKPKGEGDGYAPDKLTKLFDKMDSLPEDSPRKKSYQTLIDKMLKGGSPELERTLAERIIDGKLDFNKLSRRDGQKGRVAAWIAKIDPDFNLIDAEANIKYKTDSANLRSISLIEGIQPLYENLIAKADTLNNTRLQAYNKAINFAKIQTGDEELVAFNNLRDDVIAETERVLLGTGVLSDSKYMRALGNLNTAQSPPQMKAAIDQMMLVVQKREDALRTQPYPQKKSGGNSETKKAAKQKGSQQTNNDPLGIR